MPLFTSVCRWLKTHAGAAFLCLIGAWTGAFLLKRKDNHVNSIEQALELERHKAKVKSLRQQRLALRPLDRRKADEVMAVTQEIAKHHQRVAELMSGKPWGELSDEEIKRALFSAGL